MPVATKIAPWASQESSAQLHNFPRFFFPTLRLSIGGWRKSIRTLKERCCLCSPKAKGISHNRRLRDLLCDWYRIKQCALHVHNTRSTSISVSTFPPLPRSSWSSGKNVLCTAWAWTCWGGLSQVSCWSTVPLSSCTMSSGEGHTVPCAAPPPTPSSIHHWWLLFAVAQKPNLVSVWKTGGSSYTQKPPVQSRILTTPIWMETSQNLECDFVQGLFLWWKCYHITIPAKSPFWDRTGSKATLILEDSNHWLQLFITFTSHRVVRNRKQYCIFSCQLSPPPILHFNEELNLK